MDIAAIRNSANLDLVALSLKLIALDVKTAFLKRGLNEKTLYAEREYAHLYASLERAAEITGNSVAAAEYGSYKREHQNEADRILKGLCGPKRYASRH